MPRLYLTTTEFNELPLALGIAPQISALSASVLDKLIARASTRCDRITGRRLQAPGTTTLNAMASPGATSISVASTLTLDENEEQAVSIGTEIAQIVPGGVTVTNWASPYAGIVQLVTPLVNGYAGGTPVSFLYREVSEAGSSSSSDPYTEALQTQAMQLALAHLPPARTALTRVVFTKNYPIISVSGIEHAFSFVNQFNPVDLTIESIVQSEGWLRFNVGTVILREGLMRLTYSGGYQIIPDEIKIACSYLVAEEFKQMMNPFAMTRQQQGKRQAEWRENKEGYSPLVAEAREILKSYRRIV